MQYESLYRELRVQSESNAAEVFQMRRALASKDEELAVACEWVDDGSN